MASEIEEIVNDSIEEIVMEDIVEHKQESRSKKQGWELWVALSASLLAVLSAMTALLASFTSDEAALALSNQSDYVLYAEGVDTSHTVLKTKLDLLASMGKPAAAEDIEELNQMEEQGKAFRERSEVYEEEASYVFKTHDSLAIAVTLFQMTMLLGGVAVMVDRVAIWRFSLVFSAIGLIYLIRGLMGYLG